VSAGVAAYALEADFSHLGDDETDARLVKFPGAEKVGGLQSTRPVVVPERILFEANRKTLANVDYPINDLAWPIMSRRMLEALLAAGPFPHRAIPLVMLDDTVPTARRLDESGHPRPGVGDDRFVAVHLLEHTDALDLERSTYEPHGFLPGRMSMITRVVLKEPPGGLPPLFRLFAKPTVLFVSAAGRRALEAAGIGGVVFRPLEKVVV
jgi:hypothetical protein